MNIIENAKEIASLIKKYNDQDLYEKIVNLRDQILALREDNLALKEKVKELEMAFEIKGKLKRDGNCYYFESDKEHEHPYCITCWDYSQKLVGLIKGRRNNITIIRCDICAARKTGRD